MASRIKAPLKYNPTTTRIVGFGDQTNGVFVAANPGSDSEVTAKTIARMIACYNFCEGVPSDVITGAPASGLSGLVKSIAKLKDDTDGLIEILGECIVAMLENDIDLPAGVHAKVIGISNAPKAPPGLSDADLMASTQAVIAKMRSAGADLGPAGPAAP